MISSTLLHPFKFTPSLKLKLQHPSSYATTTIGLKLKPYPFSNSRFKCRALFSDDAPFAAAIGACMFTSLLLPLRQDDDDSTTDSRLVVMGILSFIPYFNWLSWVFAWLDTAKPRYAVYALVYLAPYFRSNLSLSPQESWLPIASILFCVVHIQLEASIRNGDIQGFQLFRSVADQLSSNNRKKGNLNLHQEMSEEGSEKENMNLPHAEEQSRDIGGWQESQRPLQPRQRLNEDLDDDKERSKH
ncbi:hypothetical protein VNO78_07620 [Psophocarpus tetragonolobus]|uniref:Uncharacterized protein n=1 Tax=Psophocarpus tetragonolobus TaxID=3891 RepID=A0AAN9SUX7_PSOTE